MVSSTSPKGTSLLLKVYKQFASPKWDLPYILCLLVLETVLSLAIVKYVSYTEIDWEAYMQEVSMWQDGELDYTKIYGGTGPLVYPAGFLYMYAFFKWLTGGGTNVLLGQYLFCGLYVLNQAVVLSICNMIARNLVESQWAKSKSKESGKTSLKLCNVIWSWRVAMGMMCLSKRIHSIFVLRLFNDGPCMLFFYISCLLFAKTFWRTGCAVFSLAVSIKMNVLLFAPGLLLLLLQSSENIAETVICLGICAGIQLILGAPFLLSYPVSYIRKAFEFDRVFFYKWTVNWKFLPEDIFVAKPLSLILLSLHLGALALFALKWIKACKKETGKIIFLGNKLSPIYVVQTLFISNFIGVVFARTLHYQFYSWYFHALPVLLWLTRLPIAMKVVLIFMVEYGFNVFPATPFSSAVLQIAHVSSIIAIWRTDVPAVIQTPCLKQL